MYLSENETKTAERLQLNYCRSFHSERDRLRLFLPSDQGLADLQKLLTTIRDCDIDEAVI